MPQELSEAQESTTIVLTDGDCHDEVLGVLTVAGKSEEVVINAINDVRSNKDGWDIDDIIDSLTDKGWNVSWDNSAIQMSI